MIKTVMTLLIIPIMGKDAMTKIYLSRHDTGMILWKYVLDAGSDTPKPK